MFWLLLLPSLLLLGELPKANRILSSLHFQYFSQYSGSSQKGTLLHYSNTACVCRAFPSTYQILQKHFQGALSLQGQFLHFSIFTIFWSLFSNPSTFPLFLFFSSTLTLAGAAISIIIPFCSFLSITCQFLVNIIIIIIIIIMSFYVVLLLSFSLIFSLLLLILLSLLLLLLLLLLLSSRFMSFLHKQFLIPRYSSWTSCN